MDYRRVNSLTEKDAYALPLIDDILSYIGRNRVLLTIDLFSGYHQVPMFPEDQEITCFTTLYGNYNFKVIPFGLCNAPSTFQREMNRIFLTIWVRVFLFTLTTWLYSLLLLNSILRFLLRFSPYYKITE